MPTNILLLGASGIPGRYILSSLVTLKRQQLDLNITVLKRSSSSDPAASLTSTEYSTAYLDDFSDTPAFASLLASLQPSIVISALNAEPAPKLDNFVVDAILQYQSNTAESNSAYKVFYVNGYTLDLLHPSVSSLPHQAKSSLKPKLEFAERLKLLADEGRLEYCTIVNAAFLDYCLVKGYSAIDWNRQSAMLIDGGDARVTGCSLEFVGEVVALVVRRWSAGNENERSEVRNKRLRVAETVYSGRSIVQVVERITGQTFEVEQGRSEDVLAKGAIVRYLNWAGNGAADFLGDGFEFGKEVLKRNTLEEICKQALERGVGVFDNVGR